MQGCCDGYNLKTKQKNLNAVFSVFSSLTWCACAPFTAVVIILKRVQRSPIRIENGNLSMSENLVTTSAYSRTLNRRTIF